MEDAKNEGESRAREGWKRNETDTSRGMEKKKVVGEPQVEERVEGWHWRRLVEPSRV